VIPLVALKLKIGSKGQVIIPKILRERYGMNEGDEVLIELCEDGILIKRKPSNEEIIETIRKIRGMVKDKKIEIKPGDLREISLEDSFYRANGREQRTKD